MANADTVTKTRTQLELVEPPMFKVIYLNDNQTSMEFVIETLLDFFNYTPDTAVKITHDIHEQGSAVVAVLPYEVAEQKGNAAAKEAAEQKAQQAAEHAAALQAQQEKMNQLASKARSESETATANLNKKTETYDALVMEVNMATTQLNKLTTDLGNVLESVPQYFQGDNEKLADYINRLMTEAADQAAPQFGYTNKFKFGSCGKKMHGKKRRK
mgnify:CR=1 FL=1